MEDNSDTAVTKEPWPPEVVRHGWVIRQEPYHGHWQIIELQNREQKQWYGPYSKVEHATAVLAEMMTLEFTQFYPPDIFNP